VNFSNISIQNANPSVVDFSRPEGSIVFE